MLKTFMRMFAAAVTKSMAGGLSWKQQHKWGELTLNIIFSSTFPQKFFEELQLF